MMSNRRRLRMVWGRHLAISMGPDALTFRPTLRRNLPPQTRMTESLVDRYTTLAVGHSATSSHIVTDTDVVLYAAVTGDLNPAHVDDAAARAGRFGARIAHGMLSGGFISALLAARLPGPGSIYMSQSMRFVRPVLIGDTVTTRVEIVELIEAKRRVRLATTCRNQRNELVLDGEALVLLPKDE